MILINSYLPVFQFGFSLFSLSEKERTDYAVFREKCLDLLAQSTRDVESAGFLSQVCDLAFFAVVVWLDERILCSDLPVTGDWRKQLLQSCFFQTTTGGELFFDHLEKLMVDDEGDSDNVELCSLYSFCLFLGFRGGDYKNISYQARELINNQKVKLFWKVEDNRFPSCFSGRLRFFLFLLNKFIYLFKNGCALVVLYCVFVFIYYFYYFGFCC